MYNNYDYPMGADNEDAPWNQEEQKAETLKCYVSQTLIKHTDVTTTDYVHFNSNIVTQYTDFEKAYKDCRYTPLELINEFAKVLPELIDKAKKSGHRIEAYKYRNMLSDCKNWEEEDFYACNDE